MNGRLIHLLGDDRGSAGRSFWKCFEPLRTVFDSYAWIVDWPPWFGDPSDFRDEDYHGKPDLFDPRIDEYGDSPRVAPLWVNGSLSRWAGHFNEEYVGLWAPRSVDPVPVYIEYMASAGDDDAFIEKHAAFRLEYTDSYSWEVFASDADLLNAVDLHAGKQADLKCVETVSRDRRWGFSQIGWETWPR